MSHRVLHRLFLFLWIAGSMAFGGCQDSARPAAQEAAELESRRTESLRAYRKGEAALKKQEYTDAQRLLEEALGYDATSISAWMALGIAHFEQSNYQRAAEAFKEASRLAPQRYEPYFNLGSVFETVGRYTDAVKAYQTALELSPDQLEVTENLARTYVRMGSEPGRAGELIASSLAREYRPEWRSWLEIVAMRLTPTTKPSTGRTE